MKAVLLAVAVALATSPTIAAQKEAPPSCHRYWSATMACGHGHCNHHRQEQLKLQCLRDGGQPRPSRRPDINMVAAGKRAPDDR